MARMIPAVVDPRCKSPGEVSLFTKLKLDPGTKDWTVLHSLDVAQHSTHVSGEIDFVVVVPEKGALCLEVKAARTVTRASDGLWYYGSDPKGYPRSPFKQASEAMHSIRKRLCDLRPELKVVPFWSAVVFTHAETAHLAPKSPFEWHPWQLIGAGAVRSRPVSTLIENVLDSARRLLGKDGRSGWFDPTSPAPTAQQCDTIVEILRPQFEFYESPKARAERQQSEVKRYTAEQFAALEAMEANDRVIFEGPAGTGKTLLAVEAARRARAAGRRVLLVCFNSLLGHWLADQAASMAPEVTAGTLHSHMRRVVGNAAGDTSSSRYWQEELPAAAVERLLEGRGGQVYDELIVDEAQDLLRRSYLDFLDLSLRGGLSAGRWRMFGDFARQSIYEPADLTLDDLKASSRTVAVYSLRRNCRNTPRIADLAHYLGGLTPRYSAVLRPDDRQDPEVRYYGSDAEQRDLLVAALRQLEKEGYSGDEVAVLSPHAVNACAAAVTETPWRDRLAPVDRAARGQVRYGTLQAFKGMEAPAVIVTDIESVGDGAAADLFYIGATRALHRLTVLAHASARAGVLERLTAAVQSGANS